MYILPEGFHDSLENPVTGSFSVFHLNIRSIKKCFEIFNTFLFSLDFTFNIICFSETWCAGSDNFIYDLLNYTSNNQKGSDRREPACDRKPALSCHIIIVKKTYLTIRNFVLKRFFVKTSILLFIVGKKFSKEGNTKTFFIR